MKASDRFNERRKKYKRLNDLIIASFFLCGWQPDHRVDWGKEIRYAYTKDQWHIYQDKNGFWHLYKLTKKDKLKKKQSGITNVTMLSLLLFGTERLESHQYRVLMSRLDNEPFSY